MEQTAKPTETPWLLIPQDGAGHLIVRLNADGEMRLIAHMLERSHSLPEDLANGVLIVTAVNAWHDADALRVRINELEGGR